MILNLEKFGYTEPRKDPKPRFRLDDYVISAIKALISFCLTCARYKACLRKATIFSTMSRMYLQRGLKGSLNVFPGSQVSTDH